MRASIKVFETNMQIVYWHEGNQAFSKVFRDEKAARAFMAGKL